MFLMGLRPGEARAVSIADYRDGFLTINKAAKGPQASAPIGSTKTRKGRTLPVPLALGDWIKRHVDPRDRLQGALLFPNPRTGRMWNYWVLRDKYLKAAKSVGLEGIKMYEATKHSMATEALARTGNERAVQDFLGHKDVRSTRRYARLGNRALIEVLRTDPGWTQVDDSVGNYLESNRDLASPAGFEPALPA